MQTEKQRICKLKLYALSSINDIFGGGVVNLFYDYWFFSLFWLCNMNHILVAFIMCIVTVNFNVKSNYISTVTITVTKQVQVLTQSKTRGYTWFCSPQVSFQPLFHQYIPLFLLVCVNFILFRELHYYYVIHFIT